MIQEIATKESRRELFRQKFRNSNGNVSIFSSDNYIYSGSSSYIVNGEFSHGDKLDYIRDMTEVGAEAGYRPTRFQRLLLSIGYVPNEINLSKNR